MTITKERKTELIQEFGQGTNDTGSPQVQIAVLTHRINELTKHMQENHKDHSSRRGLLGMVSRRRRLLDYLKRTEFENYTQLIAQLGIRK